MPTETFFELTAANVHRITKDCLHTAEEMEDPKVAPEGAVVVEGIVRKYAFQPERLESHRAEVVALIEQLPDTFLAANEGGGGGWSFLNLSTRGQEMELWGQQMDAESLYCLAAGLGLAEIQLPRDMWSALPGGVPYIVFRTKPKIEEVH